MSETKQVAPLRDQIAVAIDPHAFAFDYETRFKHCAPYKIEYVQQKWFERAEAVIALLIQSGRLLPDTAPNAEDRGDIHG